MVKHTKVLPPVYHIGTVVRDLDSTIQFLSTVFGLTPWQKFDFHLEKEELLVGGACSFRLAGAKLGSVVLELIQPLEGESVWADFLKIKGEGLHHVAFSVPDWRERVSGIQGQGGEMIAGGINVGMHWGYFSTSPGGMIIEFEEKLPGQGSVVNLPDAACDKEPNLDYIGVIVEDVDRASRFLSFVLGIASWQTTELSLEGDQLEEVAGEPCRVKVASAGLAPIALELIQPVSGRSFWSQFIETKREGISHLTFGVTDWQEMAKRIEKNGSRMVAGGMQDGRRWGYFHTTPGGIVVNLREKPAASNR